MAGEARGLKLKIDNVRKVFSTRNGEMVALNGVNLDIYENEFICVVGPSGCGKSTLLNIIAGLTDATSGTVYCNGKAVSGTGTDRGVVFQQYALFPWLTVKKNVMFALEMKGVKGKQAQDLAMQYLGYPYCYGGSSPSGFDCSGFVRYVYSQFGCSLNRTASAQMSNGTSVSMSELQPGDLVFFLKSGSGASRASHVGIYIGGGQFIHASTSSTGVIISDMDSAYYTTGFVGGRRIL